MTIDLFIFKGRNLHEMNCGVQQAVVKIIDGAHP